jgi:hypothetical protein
MSSRTFYGVLTMVYDILIHTLFGLQSHVFKYNISHYMSIHTMGKSKKKSIEVQISTGLHTAEQDFHFSNLRLII